MTVWTEVSEGVRLGRLGRPYAFESPCPGEEFALLLVIGDESVTLEEQERLSEAFVHQGCRYAMCWGHGCSSWDDSIDMVSVVDKIDGNERPFVMTTWHEDEALEETAEFFATCASFDDWEAERFVVLVLGGEPALWDRAERAVRRQFADPETPSPLRALAAFLTLPVFVAGVIPWALGRLPTAELPRFRQGWIAAVPGLAILVASVVSFYRRGRGTLAPWDPPKRLVVEDLYRFNRNPMYVGVVSILLGWALASGSFWLWTYAALLPVVFHLRVVLYEEREMARRFGDEWAEYQSAVPRWGVRLRPFDPPGASTAAGSEEEG